MNPLLPSIGLAFSLAACAGAPRDLVGTGATPVSYVLQLEIKEGQQVAFSEVMRDMVASTKTEPGTLVYEWFLGPDGRTCHIHEMFADTAAYKAHGENFSAKFADRFLPLLEIKTVHAYGNSDEEARAMMKGLDPVFYEAIGGFRR